MANQIGIETAIERCKEAKAICTSISTAAGNKLLFPLDKQTAICILQAYLNGSGRYSENNDDEIVCYSDSDGVFWINSKYGD